MVLAGSPRTRMVSSDNHLVALIRDGHEGAFEALYERHSRTILSFCRHLLGDAYEAEDAVQHTFMAAYRELAYTTKAINVRPWLFTIARNRCYSILRARRESPTDDFDQIATEGLSSQVEVREDLRELLRDMSQLPDEQRAALVLSELDALSHVEIGDVLGVRPEKVKALVYQARTSLTASKDARDTPCNEIREELAVGRGAALRRANLRRHLRECDGCREFRAQVDRQRHGLRALLPVIPSLALKQAVLGSVGVGAGGAAATVGGGAVLSGAVKGGAVKALLAALAVTAGTAGTAAIVVTGALPLGRLLDGHSTTHNTVAAAATPGAGGSQTSAVVNQSILSAIGGSTAAQPTSTPLGQFAVPAPVVVSHGRIGLAPIATALTGTTALPPLTLVVAPTAATPAATTTPPAPVPATPATPVVAATATAAPTQTTPVSVVPAVTAAAAPAVAPVVTNVVSTVLSGASTSSTGGSASTQAPTHSLDLNTGAIAGIPVPRSIPASLTASSKPVTSSAPTSPANPGVTRTIAVSALPGPTPGVSRTLPVIISLPSLTVLRAQTNPTSPSVPAQPSPATSTTPAPTSAPAAPAVSTPTTPRKHGASGTHSPGPVSTLLSIIPVVGSASPTAPGSAPASGSHGSGGR